MIIVSDTSPLMNLAVIGQLQLLHQLYDTVLLPDAVWNELSSLRSQHPEITAVYRLSWIERQPAWLAGRLFNLASTFWPHFLLAFSALCR